MVMAQLKKQSKTEYTHTIVGHVVDFFEVPHGGFYVVYHIHPQWKSVIWMITEGKSAGLSMTHFPLKNGGSDIMPYEVSLCFEPARPHCYTIVGSPTLLGVLAYKRKLVSCAIGDQSESLTRPTRVPIMSEMETEKAPTTTPIEDALSSIADEGKRALVAARLTDMMKHVDATEREHAKMQADKEKLESELAAASKQTTNARVQTELLKAQLSNVTAGLGADRVKRYNITPEVTSAAIDSRDYDQLAQVTERTLMACSRLMMEQAEVTSPSKRPAENGQLDPTMAARIETIATPAAPAAPAAAAAAPAAMEETGLTAASAGVAGSAEMTPDDYLARAMASTARSFRGHPVGSM